MITSGRILAILAIFLATGRVVGDSVDHYEVAPSVLRAAGGPPIYPAGVTDPLRANPPGPTENAIPTPPVPGLPVGTAPAGPPVWSAGNPTNSASYPPGLATPGPWNSPPVMESQACPAGSVVPPCGPAVPASWYTRVEYFHWNERAFGTDFVNENGALFTIGYTRQVGIERFRAELFGGDVHYSGYDQDNMVGLMSNTGYLGLRGEYEMVLGPAAWEGQFAVLAGLGTRFWIRDLHDGSDYQGNPVYGYQETWWTMYPFLGLESHVRMGEYLDLYSESRIGATALTYQFASINDRPLWPKPGVLANAELGLRGSRFFVATRVEVMSWAQSSVVQDSFQPNSLMVTVGGRLGFMF